MLKMSALILYSFVLVIKENIGALWQVRGIFPIRTDAMYWVDLLGLRQMGKHPPFYGYLFAPLFMIA